MFSDQKSLWLQSGGGLGLTSGWGQSPRVPLWCQVLGFVGPVWPSSCPSSGRLILASFTCVRSDRPLVYFSGVQLSLFHVGSSSFRAPLTSGLTVQNVGLMKASGCSSNQWLKYIKTGYYYLDFCSESWSLRWSGFRVSVPLWVSELNAAAWRERGVDVSQRGRVGSKGLAATPDIHKSADPLNKETEL